MNFSAWSKALFLILLICCSAIPLSAQQTQDPLNKLITIRMDSASVESLLEQLVSRNELFFSYNPDLLPSGLQNFSFQETSLGTILKSVLPDSLYQVSLIEKQLIINKQEPKPLVLSGRVVEVDGKTPVPYAAVTVAGAYIGTMTNNEGNFDLILPWQLANKDLVVSSLGYKPRVISPKEIEKEPLIRLQDEFIRLREIQVKPIDPKTILGKFRAAIPDNYPDNEQLMVCFYRETARQDGNYVGVWEAVMEVLKTGYSDYGPDRVRFIKGRKADLNRKPKEIFLKVMGGPTGINSLDIVKNLETFLSPEYEYLYQYSFEHPERIDNRLTWIIRFDRVTETDFPCFNGRLMIDAETYALVGARFSYDKKSLKINGQSFIRKEPFGFDTRPEYVEYDVRYRLLNDKWQFYSAHSDILFRVKQRRRFKTEYRNVTDMLVTEQYPFPKKARFGPEGILYERDIFSEKISTYDKSFWENYNVITPDEEVIKAIRTVIR